MRLGGFPQRITRRNRDARLAAGEVTIQPLELTRTGDRVVRARAERGPLLRLRLDAVRIGDASFRTHEVETSLELEGDVDGPQAGLIVMGETHAALAIASGPQHRQLVLLVNNRVADSHPLRGRSAKLRVAVADGAKCRFSFAEGDATSFKPIGDAFQATPGKWIGAKVGVFCRSVAGDGGGGRGHADFDYFRFGP